jgi:hypothetical protein
LAFPIKLCYFPSSSIPALCSEILYFNDYLF